MNQQLETLAKKLLPEGSRRYLGAKHRELLFRRAMRRFLSSPESCAQSGSPVLQDLIYGWGNEMWSALDEYLVACIRSALVTKGPILECGSGLTTVLVGAIAQQRGLNMWSLEHEVEWAARVRTILTRYRIDSVVVCDQPITDYGEYCWYRAPMESMPDSFDLVVCDGPPAVTKGGRYGLAPLFKGRFKPGCVILLDDAWREEEQQIAERWESELGASSSLRGTTKPFIELRVAESLR